MTLAPTSKEIKRVFPIGTYKETTYIFIYIHVAGPWSDTWSTHININSSLAEQDQGLLVRMYTHIYNQDQTVCPIAIPGSSLPGW